jgi:hypothetical protein
VVAATAVIVLSVLPGVLLGAPPAAAVPASRAGTTVPSTSEATTAVAPGDTAANGGPLLVPGDTTPVTDVASDQANSDSAGTVVALVISGLLVVALLLGLLTYWFWRNTRPAPKWDDDKAPAAAKG